MALIDRVFQDPLGNLHLVTADEQSDQPVPDGWVFIPGGVDTFYATSHANLVAAEAHAVDVRTAFLEGQQAAQANREAVLAQLASATGISVDTLIGALTDTPSTWLVPPADQPSLLLEPLLAAPVDASATWDLADQLTVTVRHVDAAAGSNTIFATLTRDVDLDSESAEVLTLVPGGSEVRTLANVANAELRLGTDVTGRLLSRWNAESGSMPAWAPVPQADDSTLTPAAAVYPDERTVDPADETIIRPTGRPGETGAPTNLPSP